MSDFVFRSRKQYWSIIKNSTDNVNNNNAEGKRLRKAMFDRTGLEQFKEKNFQKSEKKILKSDVRKAISMMKKDSEGKLKQQWREAKEKGQTKQTWKNFKESNSMPDYDAIRESYNSPS